MHFAKLQSQEARGTGRCQSSSFVARNQRMICVRMSKVQPSIDKNYSNTPLLFCRAWL